ncbi:lycopene cyclase domain-containing protein [Microbacterium sp. 1.5R]|uniref:lycopene cyclase domain-containing protein n=1 Tax=Microbacterium sp. 1.5R TaxID=1916917 RepID=UPI0011A8F9C7|nr:lycopene cyclase domain-containing protein [Microbacterium sp. 1.5R]
MTYLQLAAWFLGASVVAAVVLTMLTPRARRLHVLAAATAAVALIVLTAVFDTVMIASGLFHYSPDHLVGVRIGLAPLEDFAYPIAGAILLPALWSCLRARRAARDARAERAEA